MRSIHVPCKVNSVRNSSSPVKFSTWMGRSAGTISRRPSAPAGWQARLPPSPRRPKMFANCREAEMANRIVFLLDVDNTLLDNDRVVVDLKRHLTDAFGSDRQQRYWSIFEQ